MSPLHVEAAVDAPDLSGDVRGGVRGQNVADVSMRKRQQASLLTNCLRKETSSIAGSAKPAPTTNSRIRAVSAMKKGPGASGSGDGICPNSTKIVPASESAGLRSRAAQTEKANRPPGRSTRRVSAKAAAGPIISI